MALHALHVCLTETYQTNVLDWEREIAPTEHRQTLQAHEEKN